MKFDYQFEQKDFVAYLKEANNKYNYICLGLFTIFYFGACLDLLSTNAFSVILSYIVSVLILFTILKLITTIFVKIMVRQNNKAMGLAYGTYKIEITETGIKEDIRDQHFEVKYEDIYRISKNDKWLILYPRNEKIMYLFIKKLFPKEATYQKCVNMILKHYGKVKSQEAKPVKNDVTPSRNKKKKTVSSRKAK